MNIIGWRPGLKHAMPRTNDRQQTKPKKKVCPDLQYTLMKILYVNDMNWESAAQQTRQGENPKP